MRRGYILLAGSVMLFVAAAAFGGASAIVQGGPLDPPGPPAPTGPIQVVLANSTPNVIVAMEEQILPSDAAVQSAWLDVRACSRLDLFARLYDVQGDPAYAASVVFFTHASPDAVHEASAYQGQITLSLYPGAEDYTAKNIPLRFNEPGLPRSPFIRVTAIRTDGIEATSAMGSVDLYCS